jgi:ACS family tartrate transporter-like MFS transporter
MAINPTLATAPADTLAERTRRRITMRLAPFLFVLYILNYLDRVNVSFASLQMTGDLHFSNSVFGFGAGIFFIGYFLLQVPMTMLVETWSARTFIGLSLIVWGALATTTGFITTAQQFYTIRFLLGIAEAGFFPGVIVYLTHWYRYEDRGKAVAMFMAAIPASNMLSAAIASFLIRITWFGYAGWRWLLILEGLPAIIAGVVTFFYLTDWPKDATWLADDERSWITGALDQERQNKKRRETLTAWQALSHPQVIVFSLIYFCYITNSTGLGTWLPKIVQRISGLNQTQVILISGIPWLAALPAMLWSASHSDRSGERKLHAAVPILLFGVALLVSVFAGNHILIAIVAFSLATMALYSFPSPFWALPTIFLSGPAAAASIALINSMGNLGGFVGPYVIGYLTDLTGGFTAGLLYLVGAGFAGGLLVLSLRPERTPAPLTMPAKRMA